MDALNPSRDLKPTNATLFSPKESNTCGLSSEDFLSFLRKSVDSLNED